MTAATGPDQAEIGAVAAPRKFDAEARARAVRMYQDRTRVAAPQARTPALLDLRRGTVRGTNCNHREVPAVQGNGGRRAPLDSVSTEKSISGLLVMRRSGFDSPRRLIE